MITTATKQYIELMASAMASQSGVKIQPGKQWRADFKRKILEYNAEQISNLPLYVTRGLLLHEVGHINYTEPCKDTELQKKYPAAMHEIYNAYEDARIERKLKRRFGNFGANSLNNLNGYFNTYNLTENKNDFIKLQRLQQFLHLVLIMRDSLDNDITQNLVGYYADGIIEDRYRLPQFENIFDPSVLKRISDNKNNMISILDTAVDCPSHEEMKEYLDQRLYPIIEDFIQEFKSEDSGQGQGQSDSKPSTDKTKQAQEMNNNSGSLGRITKSFNEIEDTIPSELEAKLLLNSYASTLSQKLLDILQNRKSVKYTGNFKSGRLINKNVFKIMTNEPRPFSRKYNPDKPDRYNFFVGIDASGSMCAQARSKNAVLGAFLVKFIADKLKLNADFYIFSDRNNSQKINNPAGYELSNGGTDDTRIYELIRKDIEKYGDNADNIIIVMTDGEIGAYNFEDRSRQINELETKYKSVVFGVGIGNINAEAMNRSFKNNIIVRDIARLPIEILNILRNLIRN